MDSPLLERRKFVWRGVVERFLPEAKTMNRELGGTETSGNDHLAGWAGLSLRCQPLRLMVEVDVLRNSIQSWGELSSSVRPARLSARTSVMRMGGVGRGAGRTSMRMEREVVPSGLEAESDHDSGVAGAGSVMDDWPVTVVPLKKSEAALEVAHETVTGWPAVAGWGEAERAVMAGA